MDRSLQDQIILHNIIIYAVGILAFGHKDFTVENKIIYIKKKIEDGASLTIEENKLCLEIIETVFLDLEPWVKYDAYETYLGGSRSEFLNLWQKIKHHIC